MSVMSYVTPLVHPSLTPPTCPKHPKTPQKHPHMTITNFNYEGSYLPGLICNIVVKADLGRSANRWTDLPPLVLKSSGQDWQLADLGRSTPPKCIMGCILWDVFGSHFGFFKKRWEFPFISE